MSIKALSSLYKFQRSASDEEEDWLRSLRMASIFSSCSDSFCRMYAVFESFDGAESGNFRLFSNL